MNHLNDSELVLALDGEMEEAELKRAVDHLAECDECRAKWEGLQGLSARVAQYSASLYQGSEVADERRLSPIENKKVFSFPAWGWGLVAATALIGVSIAFWDASHRSNAHPISQRQESQDKAAAQTASAVGVSAESNAGASAAKSSDVKKAKKVPARKASAQNAQQLAANQFTELPFSDSSLPLDQATVVRVTLPAAALRQAGVPVNEDNANAMLQADVVLGMDGLPRGIRLVNSSSGTSN